MQSEPNPVIGVHCESAI